jgi:hypothetical protein
VYLLRQSVEYGRLISRGFKRVLLFAYAVGVPQINAPILNRYVYGIFFVCLFV